MKRPLIIVSIGMMIGILLELYFAKSILLFVCVISGVYIVFCNNKNKQYKYFRFFFTKTIMIIFVISILFGFFNAKNVDNRIIKLKKLDKNQFFYGTIISSVKETDYSDIYTIKLENKELNNIKLLLKIKKQNYKYRYGDLIQIKGEYEEGQKQRNYGGFNYNNYLLSIGVLGQIQNIKQIEVLKSNNLNIVDLKINEFKEKIKEKIGGFLKQDNKDLFISLILADKSNLNEEIVENFKTSNLSHILAVSGMHVAYIIAIFSIIFNIVINKRYLKIILIVVLLIYMQITGYMPSVVRACVMSIVTLVAGVFYKESDIKNSIAVSVILILLFNPYSILNLGFILSYLGSIGIMLFQKIVIKLLKKIKLRYLKEVLSVTISANILILPILLYNFNNLPINFLISNILVTPIIALIIYLGIVTIILSFLLPQLCTILGIFLNFLLNILGIITKNTSYLKNITVITPSGFVVLSYYVFVMLIWYYNYLKNKKYLYNIEKEIICIIKKIYKKTICLLIIIILLFNMIINLFSNHLKIYFIDVGQGDSTFIETVQNKNILIDGGGSEISDYNVGKKVLVPYLLDRKVRKIDFMIISHFDSDHVEGLFEVLNEIKVENIIISYQEKMSNNYEIFIKQIKEKKIKVNFVKKGDKIIVDKYTHFDILWPLEKTKLIKENSLNNNSIVAKLVTNNFSMLFTGDIEDVAEKQMIEIHKQNLKADVLKVAHHGSKTSSNKEFIRYVNPKIAIIGVGENNGFGHPNESVLTILNNNNTKIYRTDLNGEIVITSKKEKIFVKCKYKNNTV